MKFPIRLKHSRHILEITIPNDVDEGDYHFMIRVVDVNGWQAMKGLSVKIME
jgi:hypothetical protein